MSQGEQEAFEREPQWRAALRLRRYDDSAKAVDREPPALECYRPSWSDPGAHNPDTRSEFFCHVTVVWCGARRGATRSVEPAVGHRPHLAGDHQHRTHLRLRRGRPALPHTSPACAARDARCIPPFAAMTGFRAASPPQTVWGKSNLIAHQNGIPLRDDGVRRCHGSQKGLSAPFATLRGRTLDPCETMSPVPSPFSAVWVPPSARQQCPGSARSGSWRQSRKRTFTERANGRLRAGCCSLRPTLQGGGSVAP